MKIFALSLWLFLLPVSLFSQNTLSLQDCLDRARSQSVAAKVASLEREASQLDYRIFKAGLKPQLSFGANLPGLSQSIQSILLDDGSTGFVPQSQTFSTAQLNLSQAISATGGQVFASSSLASTFNNNDGVKSTRWLSNPVVIGFRQPLFRLNRYKWQQRAMDMDLEISSATFLQNLETAARVASEIYFDALAARYSLQNSEANLANNDTIFKISKGRFSVGKIAENDLLQSELNLMRARTAVASAQLDYEQAITRLKRHLGMSIQEDIELKIPQASPQLPGNAKAAASQALQHSPVLQSLDRQLFMASQGLVEAKDQSGFSLDLNASFGLNKNGKTLGEAYQNPTTSQAFSMGVNVPILQWGASRDRVGAARYRLEASKANQAYQKQSLADDLEFQVRRLQLLSEQIVRAAKSDTIAQRRFAVTKNRYLVGKVGLEILFIAQDEKDGARRSYISTLRSYWVAWARLRESSLYDFEKMEVIGRP